MYRIIIVLSLFVVAMLTSCSSLPLSGEAKARYLAREKKNADALVMAEVDCNKLLIEKKMLETRSDLTLRKQKSDNFKMIVKTKKYFNAKYKSDTVQLNKLRDLGLELGKDLETCQKVKPKPAVPQEEKKDGK
ncbi:MAG: hypothetical protein GXO88_05800 [Chlorobi bacterium]|nr:hypothetical protein [Chlorobiota bacterium]